ncbi:MAG: hypothetical protein ACI9F1_000565 [Colwellia sp.]
MEKSALVIRLSLLTNDLVFIASTFNQLSSIYKYRQQVATTEPTFSIYITVFTNYLRL